MAENVLTLKKKAVKLGMDKNEARSAGRKALEDFIAGAGKKSETKPTKTKKGAAVKKAVKKTAGKTKKATVKAKPAKTTKTKNSSKPKATKTKKSSKQSESGRNTIEKLNWSAESDEWNPRDGSPVQLLFKALKKVKGDVDKAFENLKGDVYDFVGKQKRDGTKRTKEEAHAMLRYRLNRTKFEFARRTGQHESSTNRVEYGTGQYASVKKPKKNSKPKTTKASTKKSTKIKASPKKTTAKKNTKKAGKKKTKK